MSTSDLGISRAGSHAGRGFHYQDAIGAWLAVQCWTNHLRYGEVIPEGLDDYELRSSTDVAFAQVKSRRDHLGPFPIGEVAGFVRALWNRSVTTTAAPGKLILILERPVTEGPALEYGLQDHLGLAKILSSDPRWATHAPLTQLWTVQTPSDVAVTAISKTVPCAPLAAQVQYAELLSRIGSLADINGLVKNGQFKSLAISDVEACVRRLEPILDSAAMETALREGYCDAVDFLTPIDDPNFYQGVDTRPGHLAAGLVTERPEARRSVITALETNGAVLIVGQSGTGKSALMWEAAQAVRHTTRWFELKRGEGSDAHLFIRLARALRASASAPVGFVLDDVGRGKASLWDALIGDGGAQSGILLLGSIREEDAFLLTSRSQAREIRPSVDDTVAERIWRRLSKQGETRWTGWQEPWARSRGLLLEYTHILTRGDRLEIVLGEQVDRRLREGRDAELAILRVTALAGAAGATIDSRRLQNVLSLTQGDLMRAQRRLIDEHLIAELPSGRLGGLHQLRSTALLNLCHVYPPPTLSQTVDESVQAAYATSLEALATYVVVNLPKATETLINALVVRLKQDNDPAVLAAALSGLGQSHVETTLEQWLPEALEQGLEPTQISLAVTFAVTDLDLTSIPIPDRLLRAVEGLRSKSASDPRIELLTRLTQDTMHAVFAQASINQLRMLLGAVVGAKIPETIRLALITLRPALDNVSLREASDLIGAARVINLQIATTWTDNETREQLLARVPLETAWSGPVEIESALEGRLLRGSIFHVSHSAQSNVHAEVVQLCELLFGLDPLAAIVAATAIAPDGLPSGTPDYPIAAKRIPRENLPHPAIPAWNRRWTSSAARLVGTESYTDYLTRAYGLLETLVPKLECLIESALRCKMPAPKILEQFGHVHDASRALTPPYDGRSIAGSADVYSSPVQNLIFHCSADLLRRFIQLPEGYGAFIYWVGELLEIVNQTRKEPWDLIDTNPEKLLNKLEIIISTLRLLAAESGAEGAQPTRLWLSEIRKADRGNALIHAQRVALRQLNVRTKIYLQRVKNELPNSLDLELYSRPNWDIPLPWPTSELLVIVKVKSFGEWVYWLDENRSQIRDIVGESRRIWVLPRIHGNVISRLTNGGVATLFNSPYAVDDWLDTLGLPRLDDVCARSAGVVIDLIIELDGFKHFHLGVEGRAPIEQELRIENERKLDTALVEFETLTEGKPVQPLLRHLSEEVTAGRLALAEGAAGLTHDQIMPGMEIFVHLQEALLTQDIASASSNRLINP